jgi:hypothetical protein
MHRTTLMITAGMAVCIAASTTAQAQGLRKLPLATFEAYCHKEQAARGFTTGHCARGAAIARSRYGSDVTVVQWNSAMGVVRNQMRQGK